MKNYTFSNLSKFDSVIAHFVSSRKGGTSKKPFDSLNLAFHVGDKKELVLKNRKKLAEEVGVDLKRFVFMNQTHSKNVRIVTKEDAGRGTVEWKTAIPNTDALITNTPGIFLITQVADCVPILFFDPIQKVIAIAHAGWQGTLKKITKEVIRKMQKKFNCQPNDIIAGIGPSIGPCCFEVGEDVISQLRNSFSEKVIKTVTTKKNGKTFIDLWKLNKKQLIESGIAEENIEIIKICTVCNTDNFFSYRKEKETGRFGIGIILK